MMNIYDPVFLLYVGVCLSTAARIPRQAAADNDTETDVRYSGFGFGRQNQGNDFFLRPTLPNSPDYPDDGSPGNDFRPFNNGPSSGNVNRPNRPGSFSNSGFPNSPDRPSNQGRPGRPSNQERPDGFGRPSNQDRPNRPGRPSNQERPNGPGRPLNQEPSNDLGPVPFPDNGPTERTTSRRPSINNNNRRTTTRRSTTSTTTRRPGPGNPSTRRPPDVSTADPEQPGDDKADPGQLTQFLPPRGCECTYTREFNPVCGTNGVTYSNQQLMQCYRRCGTETQIRFFGSCSTTTTAAPQSARNPW